MDISLGKTGIIYARVSSKDQVENTSLDFQERLCREYALREGIEILKVFVERGESAKTANRTEFLSAITFCSNKKRKVDYFIIYKLDRFARNQYDHETVRAGLLRFGTALRSVTEPINETPVGRAMEGMISVFAELDNNMRTERTRAGMLERLKAGSWVWQAPLGYCRSAKAANISPDPQRGHLIRLAFEEWAKGAHSYRSLSKFLNERGLRTRSGKPTSPQLMEKILKNPLYCGIMNVWGEQYPGVFEPLIDQELFYKCQKGKKGSLHSQARRSANPDFPLSKTLCNLCGMRLTGSFSRGKSGQRYPHYHHQKQGCSQAKFIPKAAFEQAFIEYLNDVKPDVRYEKTFRAIMLDIWQSNYKKFDEGNRRLTRELEGLEKERQRVFDIHRNSKYTDEEFEEQKARINEAIQGKRQLIAENHVEEFDMEEALSYCFQFIRDTAATWLRFRTIPEHRLRFQKNIFPENLIYDGKKFGTPKIATIYELKQQYDGETSNLVALVGRNWDTLLAELNEWHRFGEEVKRAEIALVGQ